MCGCSETTGLSVDRKLLLPFVSESVSSWWFMMWIDAFEDELGKTCVRSDWQEDWPICKA
jgi:hypothetical protein